MLNWNTVMNIQKYVRSILHNLKSNENLEIKKSKLNFWDLLPKISEEEKKQEIEDLGYNSSEQTPVGKERSED